MKFQFFSTITIAACAILSAVQVRAQLLLSEDFSTGDGGFTVINDGGPEVPWVFNAGPGTWTTDGSTNLGAPSHTRLTSPVLTVDASAEDELSFEHRYDIEGGQWDGAAVFFSINGGPFTQILNAEYSENAPTESGLIGNHDLNGGEGFGGISPGHGAGNLIISVAGPFSFDAGDTVQIQFLMANDEFARGTASPNWEISSVTLGSVDDTDGDGMPDGFEEANGLDPDVDDSAGDPDGDSLTNLEEFMAGTNPQDGDTDGDGINDGDEITAGTNPTSADSDGDGLSDAVETGTEVFVSETDTGTDPNESDTDGDGFGDGEEVNVYSTDPNDPNSRPEQPSIELLGVGTGALLNNDLTDPEGDGVQGPTDPGPPQTAGSNFNWVSIHASSEESFGNFGGSEGAFDVFDNTTGGGQNKWCCNGPPQHITVEFEDPVSLTHFVIAGSNDIISHNRAPLDWGIYGSNISFDDDASFEPIVEFSDDTPIWQADEEVYRFNLPSASPAYKFIRYFVTRTNGGNHEIGEIEYFGSVGPVLFRIIEVNPAPDLSGVELVFDSTESRVYSVEISRDLNQWVEIDDGVTGQGETTSFTDSFPPPDDGNPTYYRVKQVE